MALPTRAEAEALLATYELPDGIITHSRGVSRVAAEAARLLATVGVEVDPLLVEVAALLHDIDKRVTRKSGEPHGIVGARWLTELGYPNSDVPVWYSVWAPAGTPADIIDRLNARMVEIAKSDDMIAKMAAINVVVPPQTPDEMTKFRDEDMARNADVIKAANIKLE